jgi:HTH-type transcriptional regulator / antitoxin HigA
MDINQILTQAEYQTALKEISTLIDIDPELGTGEADRLEVLGALVEAYETKHYKVSEIV